MEDPGLPKRYRLLFGSSLPPGVSGRHRGQVEFYVERFQWVSAPVCSAPVVHVKWWGDESDGSWLPFDQPRRNVYVASTALVFPILTSIRGFRSYAHDLGVVKLDVEDAHSGAVIGSTFVPIHQITEVGVAGSFAVHCANGNRVARIDIKMCAAFAPQAVASELGSPPAPVLESDDGVFISPRKKYFRRKVDVGSKRVDGFSLELPSMKTPVRPASPENEHRNPAERHYVNPQMLFSTDRDDLFRVTNEDAALQRNGSKDEDAAPQPLTVVPVQTKIARPPRIPLVKRMPSRLPKRSSPDVAKPDLNVSVPASANGPSKIPEGADAAYSKKMYSDSVDRLAHQDSSSASSDSSGCETEDSALLIELLKRGNDLREHMKTISARSRHPNENENENENEDDHVLVQSSVLDDSSDFISSSSEESSPTVSPSKNRKESARKSLPKSDNLPSSNAATTQKAVASKPIRQLPKSGGTRSPAAQPPRISKPAVSKSAASLAPSLSLSPSAGSLPPLSSSVPPVGPVSLPTTMMKEESLLPSSFSSLFLCFHIMYIRNLSCRREVVACQPPRICIRLFSQRLQFQASKYSAHKICVDWMDVLSANQLPAKWFEMSLVCECWMGESLLGLASFPLRFLYGYVIANNAVGDPLTLVEQAPLHDPFTGNVVASMDFVMGCGPGPFVRQLTQRIAASMVVQRFVRRSAFCKYFLRKSHPARLQLDLHSAVELPNLSLSEPPEIPTASPIPGNSTNASTSRFVSLCVSVESSVLSGIGSRFPFVNVEDTTLHYALADNVVVVLPVHKSSQMTHRFVDPRTLFLESSVDHFDFTLRAKQVRYTQPYEQTGGSDPEVVIGTVKVPRAFFLGVFTNLDAHKSVAKTLDFGPSVQVTLRFSVVFAVSDNTVSLKQSMSLTHLPTYDLIKEHLPGSSSIKVHVLRACGLKAAAKFVAERVPELAVLKDIGVNSYVRFSPLRKTVHPSCSEIRSDGLPFIGSPSKARTFTPNYEFAHAFQVHFTRDLYSLLAFGDAMFQVWHAVPSSRLAEGGMSGEGAADILLGTVSFPARRLFTASQGVRGWFSITNDTGHVVGSLQLQMTLDKGTLDVLEKLMDASVIAAEEESSVDDAADRRKVKRKGRHVRTGCDADGSVVKCTFLIDHVVLPVQSNGGGSRSGYFVEFPVYGESHPCKTYVRGISGGSDRTVRFQFTQDFVRVENSEMAAFFGGGEPLVFRVFRTDGRGKDVAVGHAFVDCRQLVSETERKTGSDSGAFRWVGGVYPLIVPTEEDASAQGNIVLKILWQKMSSFPRRDSESEPDADSSDSEDGFSQRQKAGKHSVPPDFKLADSDDDSDDDSAQFSADEEAAADGSPSNLLKISVDSGMHLPPVLRAGHRVAPSTFIQFPTVVRFGSSRVVVESSNPFWKFAVDIPIFSEHELDEPMFFEVRELLDAERRLSRVMGTVAIDMSVLRRGLPFIRGYYNITNIRGDSQGQVLVDVRPVRPFRRTANQMLADFAFGASASAAEGLPLHEEEIRSTYRARDHSASLAAAQREFEAYRQLIKSSVSTRGQTHDVGSLSLASDISDIRRSSEDQRTFQDLLRHSLRFSHLFDRGTFRDLAAVGTYDSHSSDNRADFVQQHSHVDAGASANSDSDDAGGSTHDSKFAELSRKMDELDVVQDRLHRFMESLG
eukprot:ANDGO_00655.mRNA.1 hypothetical protein